jgi:hypothetical protein
MYPRRRVEFCAEPIAGAPADGDRHAIILGGSAGEIRKGEIDERK